MMMPDINENNHSDINKSQDFKQDLDEYAIDLKTLSELLSFYSAKKGIKITSLEQFYDDKVYIAILKMIVVKEDIIELLHQEKEIGKLRNMRKILQYLSSEFELNLEHIDPNDIIIHKNEESVKYLLSVLIDLVKVIHANENCTKETITTFNIDDDIYLRSSSVQNDQFYTRKQLEKCIKENIADDNKDLSSSDTKPNLKERKIHQMNTELKNSNKKLTTSINDNRIQTKEKFTVYKDEEVSNSSINKNNIAINSNSNSKILNINEDIVLSVEEVKIELMRQMRKISSEKRFKSIMMHSNNTAKLLANVITEMRKELPEKEVITHNYLQMHLKEIRKIIKKTFENSNRNSTIINKIASSLIKDKSALNQMNKYDKEYTLAKSSHQKSKHEQLQKQSNHYKSTIKAIYQKVYQLQRGNCIEDMNSFSDYCLQKEAQMLIMNKLNDNHLRETRVALNQRIRLERIIKEKKKELEALKQRNRINKLASNH